MGESGWGGLGGEQMEARVLARVSSGKDNCLLLVNFLFVNIFCCVRSQQIEEESVIMMDDFLSLVDVTLVRHTLTDKVRDTAGDDLRGGKNSGSSSL